MSSEAGYLIAYQYRVFVRNFTRVRLVDHNLCLELLGLFKAHMFTVDVK